MSVVEAPCFDLMANAMKDQFPKVETLDPTDRAGVRTFLFSTLPGRRDYMSLRTEHDNGEALERMPAEMSTGPNGYIIAEHDSDDAASMREYTGADHLAVRAGVIDELQVIAEAVGSMAKGHILKVTYGFRPPALQQAYFNETLAEFRQDPRFKDYDEERLFDEVHRLVAWVPAAEHLTGGVYDWQILDGDRQPLDIGLSDDTDTEFQKWPWLTRVQWENRQLGETAMTAGGHYIAQGEPNHSMTRRTAEGAWYANREHASLYPGSSPLGLVAVYGQLSVQDYLSARPFPVRM